MITEVSTAISRQFFAFYTDTHICNLENVISSFQNIVIWNNLITVGVMKGNISHDNTHHCA